MVVGYAQTGTATAVGYDASGFSAAAVRTGAAKAVGYAALGIPAAPAAGTVPDALRLEILTPSGTQLVNDLVNRRNLSFTVEHNGSGVITFDTDLAAFTNGIDDTALTADNLVRVHFGDLPAWPYGVAEGILSAALPIRDDSGRWALTVTCPGSWDVLDYGLLWAPDGATGDTREFSYTAGQTGPAWVPEEWGKPSGYLVKNSFRWKHRWPRGWPEDKSRWLWSTSPEKASGSIASAAAALIGGESRKFVGTFTLTEKRAVHFYVAGDDTLKLYLNGARIKKKGRGAWHRTCSFIRTLKAGTYTLAAEVQNLVGGDSKAGFICAVAQLKPNGSRDKWLLRSNTDTFQVKTGGGYIAQVPLPPDGWYPAAVLYQHLQEAKARGVEMHAAITATFSTTADSTGVAWTTKGQAEYDIGISGAQLGENVRSSGVDAAMLPGLRLFAWRSRGFDLRSRVTISNAGVGWSSRTWSRVRSVALTRHESGWTQTSGDAAIAATYGRRELTVSGGGTDGDQQADALATQALSAAASPEETIEVTISSASIIPGKNQPFLDFNVADTITAETVGGFTPIKVMSITGDEQDDKSVLFRIAGYPV